MKLENEFTVPAPLEQAWAVLLDVERVAPCLPGASVEPGGDDGEYAGTMTIKIGPITSRYKGTVKIERADEEARVAVMRAQAKDARGQGTASATITSSMVEVPDGTRVTVETDLRVTGPAAQFGRGVMQDVSRQADAPVRRVPGGGDRERRSRGRQRRRAPRPGPEIEPEPEPAASQAPAPEPAAPTNGGPQEPRGAAERPRCSISARRAARRCSSARCPWSARSSRC